MFWNCQGIRSKRKELELYLKENPIDIIALNETFLHKKINFKIQGYDTIRNDRSTGSRGGVAFLVKHGLVPREGLPIKSDGGSECWALPLTLKYKKKFLFLTTLEYIFCKTEAPEV